MVIHNIRGCMAFSLNVDNREEIDMSNEERLQVIDEIYEWMKRNPEDKLNYILQGLTDYFGEYNVIDDRPCECCGDIVDETYLDLSK